jgi:acyl transferase domain-containing protein/phosphopantetheinyl transferase
MFPGAPTLDAYWQNIVSGVDAITDVPPGRWDPDIFFDPGSTAGDRLYCKRGGYLGALAEFNPLEYGIMPKALDGGEAGQLLSLRVASDALTDAGYAERPFDRERAEIILGRGEYLNRSNVNLTMHTIGVEQTLQILKDLHPEYTPKELEAIKKELRASLPPCSADTAGFVIPNLTTGRIANRLDLMGANFTVDAACASSLIATDLAVRDLLAGRCDLAIAGGIHLATHVPFLTLFCQLSALSRRSQIRPFDEGADGTLTGEGVGMVVLKRSQDAERDGDRIYAVIKGVGISSDGRGQGPFAPRVEGEELAIRRAYDVAGISPETVGLIEAHGTAMPVGDLAEVQALTRVFGPRKGRLPTCAVGSVKSMIGHAMPAAGIAGLIKATLALYHKVLPPTLNCDTPNTKFELAKTPFYINTEARPWIHGAEHAPRRAGVNAFGFGGINAHVVLEEHHSSAEAGGPDRPLHWETEVCIVQGTSRQDLLHQVRRLERCLDTSPQVHLKDLAYTLNTELREGSLRLALVSSSIEDLRKKLAQARERLADLECRQIKDVGGLYFFEEPLITNGKVAFLFPGEGSQYPNMLKHLCLHFPEVRAVFDRADQLSIEEGRPLLLSQCIFRIPGSSDEERVEAERRLGQMGVALEAIMVANWALYTLLRRLEIRPDIMLGHSAGEHSALAASGILAGDALVLKCFAALNTISEQLTAEGKLPEAALAAVGAGRMILTPLLDQFAGQVFICNDNCPHQVVIAGQKDAVKKAIEQLRAEGVVCQELPFNRAYHTTMFEVVTQAQREFFQELPLSPPETEIYSCSTMRPYPRDPEQIRELINELWSRAVEFSGSIEALYAAGARIFVEVGPKGNLTAFVDDILRNRPYLAIGCDVPRRSGITQLNHLIGVLAAQGVGMRLNYLYERRSPRRLPLDEPRTGSDRGARQLPSQTLPLDLPTMRISSERIRSRAPRPPAPAERATPTPASREGQRPAEFPPSLGSLAPVGNPLQHLAHVPPGLDQAEPLHQSLGVASQIMQDHLQTMERFLAIERQIIETFLDASGSASATESPGTTSVTPAPALPFVGAVTSFTPGREVVMRRRIDPEEDVFLEDHCFGRKGSDVSDVDKTLGALPVMPFTMFMEIMAEAAALLMPGKVLTGMRQIEVRQWVEVATPITLEITARRRTSGEEVDVQITNLGSAAEVEVPTVTPTAEGIVIFGDAYPQSPPIAPLSLTSERPCRHTAEQMYKERLMFHGPRFQGVVSLDRTGENGIVGHLQVLPQTDLFQSTTAPHLLTDPVLLDAASQLLGPWAVEYLDAGYVMFPVRLSALEHYGPLPPVSEWIRCEVEIERVTPREIDATMSFFGQDGHLLQRLVNWQDMRFFWPRELYNFCRFPKQYLLSMPWEMPVAGLPEREHFVCQRLSPTGEHTRAITMRSLVHTILSSTERQSWGKVKGSGIRQAEWLFGRAAAKDAVRWLLQKRYGMEIFPADIEIGQDPDGRPFASIVGSGESAIMPAISIAHSDGLAVAIAGYCSEGQRLGIDVERLRPRQEAFQEIAFSDDELALLGSLPDSARDEWVTRFWCAKEAAAKALGKGLVGGPRSVAVRKVHAPTGTVEVVLGDGLAQGFPELAGVPLVVYTAREEGWVVASTLCERS